MGPPAGKWLLVLLQQQRRIIKPSGAGSSSATAAHPPSVRVSPWPLAAIWRSSSGACRFQCRTSVWLWMARGMLPCRTADSCGSGARVGTSERQVWRRQTAPPTAQQRPDAGWRGIYDGGLWLQASSHPLGSPWT